MKIDIRIDEHRRRDDGLSRIWVEIPGVDVPRELDISFVELFNRCRVPDELVLDLLIVASLTYVVDKSVPRSSSFDFWTRELSIEFPVAEPTRWRKVSGNLERTLNFLTGDLWTISFRKRDPGLFIEPSRERKRKPLPEKLENIRAVCSLSGGTDSLAGAIGLLEEKGEGAVHLIGHYDAPGAKKAQQQLFSKVAGAYALKADLTQVRVSHKPVKAKESTLRSRSLVFMAIGLFAARAAGNEIPVYMPENGFIAMNLPLTPARAGSCSTRTMHPFYLDRLRETLLGLGIRNPIVNPLELKTKGECLTESPNLRLLKSAVDDSVSCSHGTRKQTWTRRAKEIRNCGYCVPCIVRRAAMHKAGIDRGDQYGLDICTGEIKYNDENGRANDLRAVLNLIVSNKATAEIQREILAVAPVDRLTERARVIEKGIGEIRTLLSEKGTKDVRRSIGIQ